MAANLTAERQQTGVTGTHDSTAERKVDDRIHEHTAEQFLPGIAQCQLFFRLITLPAKSTESLIRNSLGNILLDTFVERVGKLNDIRCKESSDNTDSYHHGIDEFTGYSQRFS